LPRIVRIEGNRMGNRRRNNDREPLFQRQDGLRAEERMTARLGVALALAALALAACGTTPQDRALSGGAIGAGAGVVGGALAGHPLTGALIGGAGGAAAGGLTKPDQVDLGRPAWL
jgi:osmotically inducible lipoprotein OsmB